MSRSSKTPSRGILCLFLAISLCLPQPLVVANPDDGRGGDVGLSDLIALALKNDLGLIAKRGEISIAEARKRTARDWRDPQLRLSKTWGYNNVPPPYSETRKENYNQRVTRSEVNEKGEIEKSTSTERVSRTTERKVTPGRDRTVTKEKIRERSGETTNTEANLPAGNLGGISTDSQNLYRTGSETRYNDIDPFAREDDLALQFRLYVPHPGIRKARIERAQREIDLARAEALAEEREVVLQIREDYEELQYLSARVQLFVSEDAAAEAYETVQDELLADGLMTIDEFVRRDGLAADAARIEFEAKRDRLAARAGLRDPSRIRVTDKLISPSVDLDHTHLEYLIRMAFANRGDLAAIRGRGQIAESDLKEAKAKRIPWFEYFQAEYGQSERGDFRDETSWGVQLAMSVPIFTWLGHEREIHEAAIASHFAQMGAGKELITAEVAAAYQSIKRAAAHLAKARGYSATQAERTSGFLSRIEGMDRRDYEDARYNIARSSTTTDLRRLDAEQSYNRALLQLEEAIGAPLVKIFTSGAKEVTASAAPASPRPGAGETTASAAPAAPRAIPVEPEPKRRRSFFSRFNGSGTRKNTALRGGKR